MKIVPRYVISNVFSAYGLAALGIGSLFFVLDLLERVEDGVEGIVGLLQMVVSAMLAMPQTLIDVLPVIAVMATALAMGRLQTLSELTVMRVSGISIWRLSGLALIPGLFLAAIAIAALQWVIPHIQQAPEQSLGASLGESGLWHPTHGLWIRQDNQFLNVADLELGRLPVGIDIFRFDSNGGLEEHIQAQRGLVASDGQWLLSEVVITDYTIGAVTREVDQMAWTSFLTQQQLELLLNAPSDLSLSDLWRYVAGLKTRGQPYQEFELILWQRLSLPLACVAMMLAAMATAAVPLKSRVIGVRIVAALVLGLGFELVTELVSYLGLLLGWPVVPVALVPPVLLTGLSIWLVAQAR